MIYIVIVLILEFALILVLNCLQVYLYLKTVDPSKNWKNMRFISIILALTTAEVTSQILSLNFASLSWMNNIIVVLFFGTPLFLFGGKLKERIFFSIVNLAIFIFSILLSLVFIFPDGLIMKNPNLSTLIFGIFLIIFIYFILVLLIAHFNTEGKRYIPHNYWIGIIFCFVAVCVGLTIVNALRYFVDDKSILRSYQMIFALGLLVVWLLLYFVFYFISKYFSTITETNALIVQNDMIEKYMSSKQASDERIKMLSHDLKHSLVKWRTLAEDKGDTDEIQSITEYEL